MSCEYCDDGDGGCIYPRYGLAPHIHNTTLTSPTGMSTHFTGEVPENFKPDTDETGCGIYTHCLECGSPTTNGSRE